MSKYYCNLNIKSLIKSPQKRSKILQTPPERNLRGDASDYDAFGDGDKSAPGKLTAKSSRCVIAIGLLFSSV